MMVLEFTVPDIVKLSERTIYDYETCKQFYYNNSQNYDKAKEALDKKTADECIFSIFKGDK
jgi:hypothetical protein